MHFLLCTYICIKNQTSYVVDTRKAIIELEKKTKFVKEKCFECNVFRRARSIEIALLLDPIGNLKRNNNLNVLRD